jgi:type I restriction enzyme R subunit
VEERFVKFVEKHQPLNSHQVKFLDLLKDHIRKYGAIEAADLYEPPFTLFHSDGPEGVFGEELATELFAVIYTFAPSASTPPGNMAAAEDTHP